MGLLVILLALVVAVPGCVSREQYVRAKNTIERQDSVIQSYRNQFDSMEGELARMQEALREKEAELGLARSSEESLRDAHASLAEKYAEIESRLGSNLPEGVRMVSRPEGVAFDVLGEVLFDSGRAEIKEAGKGALLDVISRIRAGSERIRVEGHTDNEPVTVHRNVYPLGNLQLSGIRALNVAQFLIDNGVDADRVSYAGYGEFRPTASNDNPDGRRQNRRVEILVLFEPRN
jgi:flagellar motor protein MotB